MTPKSCDITEGPSVFASLGIQLTTQFGPGIVQEDVCLTMD